jgi:hypothetical protein
MVRVMPFSLNIALIDEDRIAPPVAHPIRLRP